MTSSKRIRRSVLWGAALIGVIVLSLAPAAGAVSARKDCFAQVVTILGSDDPLLPDFIVGTPGTRHHPGPRRQ